VKNRMREFRTSGSVRDGDGNVPIYSATERRRGGRSDRQLACVAQRRVWPRRTALA
jgi:hypothetical protein